MVVAVEPETRADRRLSGTPTERRRTGRGALSDDQDTFDVGGFGGDAGGVLYDISSLLVGGKSSIRNVKNISGKKLNDIVKGSDVLINSVNTGRTTKDYLDKEY